VKFESIKSVCESPVKPALIVTIDTEEEGLWNGSYPREGLTVENTRGIPRFQELCNQFGVRPTYLVDTPVVNDDRSVSLLGEIARSNRCEIGAHLHPWCAPPFYDAVYPRDSYLCNLQEGVQRAKLTGLTEAIERRFGCRPTSFRAGRYGLDMTGASILRELGYSVDSSVIPYSDFSHQQGPDFRRAPYAPYRLGGYDICRPCPDGFLCEVPVSVGYNRKNFDRADRLLAAAGGPRLKLLHTEGILDRLGVVRKIKLSPEQADGKRMKQLINALNYLQAPALVMMLHSSSLLPGLSPYVRTPTDLEKFFGRLQDTFGYCIESQGMISRTLSEFASDFGGVAA
jgi:hypothetical protein